MPDIGVSFSQKAIELKKQSPNLIRTIEVYNLADLQYVEGDWIFHCQKEDPFVLESALLNLLEPNQIKMTLGNKKMKELLQRHPPKIISFHLGFSAKVFGPASLVDHHAAGSILTREEVFRKFCQSLEIIRGSFLVRELHLLIALENIDYCPNGVSDRNKNYFPGRAFKHICQADFIDSIFESNPDLYLLLDIAHAEISAMALCGGKLRDKAAIVKDYLQHLPLKRLIEIHINAPQFEDSQTKQDAHLPIGPTELEILEWLLNLGLPDFRVVNLECQEKISEQVKQLGLFLKKK